VEAFNAALKAAEEFGPQIAVLDIDMPVMDRTSWPRLRALSELAGLGFMPVTCDLREVYFYPGSGSGRRSAHIAAGEVRSLLSGRTCSSIELRRTRRSRRSALNIPGRSSAPPRPPRFNAFLAVDCPCDGAHRRVAVSGSHNSEETE